MHKAVWMTIGYLVLWLSVGLKKEEEASAGDGRPGGKV
jgi:hypothetical protein